MEAAARMDLDGNPVALMTIWMIGARGFIGSHLCEKLMTETPHTVLAVDVYSDKIKQLLDPASSAEGQEARHPWDRRIHFHHLNIKHDSRVEGLIKMSELVRQLMLTGSLGHVHIPILLRICHSVQQFDALGPAFSLSVTLAAV